MLLLLAAPCYTQTASDTTLARLLYKQSVGLTDSGQYRIAKEHLWEASRILEAGNATETALYATVLHQRGIVFLYTYNPDSAIILNKAALAIREKLFGYNSDPVARSLTNIGEAYYRKFDFNKALEYSQLALLVAKSLQSGREEAVSSAYNNISNAYVNRNNLLMALTYADSALSIREEQRPVDSANLAISYNNMGNLQILAGHFDQAVILLEKSLALRLAVFGKWHRDVAATYCNLGAAVYFTGENTRALDLLETAHEIRLRILPPDDFDMAESYANLMLPLVRMGDYDRAIAYGRQALAIVKKYGPRGAAISGLVHLAWGNALVLKGDPDEAIRHSRTALQFFIPTKNLALAAEALNNIGGAYGLKRDYQNQKKYMRQAFEQKAPLLRDHPDLAIAFINLGLACQNLNELDSALLWFDQAEIHLARIGGKSASYTATLHNARALVLTQQGKFDAALAELAHAKWSNKYNSPGVYQGVVHWDNLLTTFAEEGQIWRSRTDAPRHLEQARASFLDACAGLEFLRSAPYEPGSKSAINARAFPLQTALIATDMALHQKTGQKSYCREAFRYAELSKGMSLYLALRNSGAKVFADLPADFALEENALRADIARLETQIFSADSGQLDSLNRLIVDRRDAFRRLQQRMKVQCPEYYALHYTYPGETLESAQGLLLPGQTLLEYVVSDSAVFVFALQADTFAVAEVRINADFPLDSLVRLLRYGLTELHLRDPNSLSLRKKTADAYAAAGYALYMNLVAPVAGLLTETVIVVPDGVLSNIPFDVLLQEKPVHPERFQSHAYLGRFKRISYAYSAALLREMRGKQHQNPPTDMLWALAPLAHSRRDTLLFRSSTLVGDDTLFALPASGREVAEVASLFGGTFSQGIDATKERVFAQAGHYRVLHLCLHGKADRRAGERAWLAFATSDGDTTHFEKLYAAEIYRMTLNADLVTLSACETGIGEIQRGEGLISLARAFAYAGAKSVVASLWLVDDARTPEFMRLFYQNLKNGQDKDTALWQVKRDRMEQGEHPFFWAAFVPLGDMAPVARN